MKMQMFTILDKAKPDMENMRLELGSGQTYNCSSGYAAIVA
jgi:hypothetical protein